MGKLIDTDDAPPELNEEFLRAFQRLIGAVFRLNGQLLSTAEQLADDLEISTGRWQTIAILRYSPLTVSQISRRLGVTRQSSRQTVQRLEAAELVELIDNPDHARASLVRLTDKGQTMMQTLFKRQALLTQTFTDGLDLDPDKLDFLTGQLEMLREHAEELDIQTSKK